MVISASKTLRNRFFFRFFFFLFLSMIFSYPPNHSVWRKLVIIFYLAGLKKKEKKKKKKKKKEEKKKRAACEPCSFSVPYLWWSVRTLYLLACQVLPQAVRDFVVVLHVTSFERCLTPFVCWFKMCMYICFGRFYSSLFFFSFFSSSLLSTPSPAN